MDNIANQNNATGIKLRILTEIEKERERYYKIAELMAKCRQTNVDSVTDLNRWYALLDRFDNLEKTIGVIPPLDKTSPKSMAFEFHYCNLVHDVAHFYIDPKPTPITYNRGKFYFLFLSHN